MTYSANFRPLLKNNYSYFLFVFALLITVSKNINAQTRFTIEVAITVYEGKKKLEGATVQVIKNGKDAERKSTDKSGKANLILMPNHEYLIMISKNGFISKSIEMNTKGMLEGYQETVVFRTKPEVELFRYAEGMDTTVFEKPMGKFLFDTESNDFYFDYSYTDERQTLIAEAGKEFEQKEKEKSNIQSNYDNLIAKADKALSIKNYGGAKAAYNEALVIMPEESYPEKKLIEIEAALSSIRAAREKADQEAKDKTAAEAKRKADELAKLYAVEEAKLDAIEKAEADELKKQEIEKEKKNKAIVEAEAKRKANDGAKRNTYDQIIAKADQYFNSKEYNAAKAAYNEALAIYSEQYPRNRIAEIERLLAKMNAGTNTGDNAKEIYTSELAKKYPEGITEEITQESNRKIIRRIVVRGNEANDYLKISYSWGTYYFKNGDISISENVWNAETK